MKKQRYSIITLRCGTEVIIYIKCWLKINKPTFWLFVFEFQRNIIIVRSKRYVDIGLNVKECY